MLNNEQYIHNTQQSSGAPNAGEGVPCYRAPKAKIKNTDFVDMTMSMLYMLYPTTSISQ
jgi:hypothetical protein